MVQVAPAGFGLVATDQLVPFHCSTRVFGAAAVPEPPTAKQLVALGQETPLSSLISAPMGFGLVSTDQVVPFQRSTSVVWSVYPTAMQFVALKHDSPNRTPFGGPAGLVLAATVHIGVALAGSAAALTKPATRLSATISLREIRTRRGRRQLCRSMALSRRIPKPS